MIDPRETYHWNVYLTSVLVYDHDSQIGLRLFIGHRDYVVDPLNAEVINNIKLADKRVLDYSDELIDGRDQGNLSLLILELCKKYKLKSVRVVIARYNWTPGESGWHYPAHTFIYRLSLDEKTISCSRANVSHDAEPIRDRTTSPWTTKKEPPNPPNEIEIARALLTISPEEAAAMSNDKLANIIEGSKVMFADRVHSVFNEVAKRLRNQQ